MPRLDPDRPTPEGFRPAAGPFRTRLFEIIFHADDPAGKVFDVVLIVAILASVVVVMLESVAGIQARYARALVVTEWFFTVLFTVEYAVRLWAIRKPSRYARSFFGVVDLLAILPTYVSLIVPGAQVLLTVRILRALRVFRVLKLANYLDEADQLRRALSASRRKILVFIFVILTVVTVMGSMMYLIEGAENGFTSIPESVYWAVVTLSTVGYGDISPVTPLGKAVATIIIVMGYGIIAVPTGIVTAELTREVTRGELSQMETASTRQLDPCPTCGLADHDDDAKFCKRCGEPVVVRALPSGSKEEAAPPASVDA